MNELDQRLAIAEAVGWKPSDQEIAASKTWEEITGQSYIPPGPPDYTGDLNAMHEAVNTLSEKDKKLWSSQLCLIVGGPRPPWPHEVHNATAPQRAEAFLRTIGKWQCHRPANASNCDSQPMAPF